MITGYDPGSRRLTIGIGDLVDLGRLPDSLVPAETPMSLQERQRAHASYQRRMEKEGWEKEFTVEAAFRMAGMEFLVRGRIDLLRRSEGGARIIEVKTIMGEPRFDDPLRGRSRDVLQLYFYALALRQGGDEAARAVSAGLVYLDLSAGRRKQRETEYPVDLDDPFLEAMWTGMLEDTAGMLIAEDRRKSAQISAIQDFDFPYDTMRPGQRLMMEGVERCIENGGYLLMQAPTGTGKTAAILSGAVRSALPERFSVFFLTAKNTHKMIVDETLRLIMDRGVPLRAIFISAKASVCHMGRERCLPHDCPYAVEFGSRVRSSGVMERLLASGIIDPAGLVEASGEAGVCAFELGLCLSTRCDMVICDYNYVFDPHVFLRRFFLEKASSSRCCLLVDEAANLPSRARDFHSPEVRSSWIDSLLQHSRCTKRWRKLLEPWTLCFEEWSWLLGSEGGREIELPPDTAVPSSLDRWLDLAGGMVEPPEPMLDLVRSLVDFSRIDPGDGRYHLLFREDGGERFVQWFCTDPSAMLNERTEGCRCTVAFSATLSPLRHFGDLLGFPDGSDSLDVPYPFPRQNLGVWISPDIDTRFRNRERSSEALAERILGICGSVPGSWLVYFPSYGYTERIAGILSSMGAPVMVQRSDMSSVERTDFISRIENGDVLAMMVSGGIFSEGVDIRSEKLRGAIVVGPSLPGVDLRSRLLCGNFEDRGMNGFVHTWAIPGMVRVVQAAGRLIRNSTQRRVLVLVGRRFTQQPYIGLLPGHWFSGGSIPLLTGECSEIARFLTEKGEGTFMPSPEEL